MVSCDHSGLLFVAVLLLHKLAHSAVAQNNSLVGLITPNEVKKVSRGQWLQTSVQSVMPPRDLRVVAPDTPAIDALRMMSREDNNLLLVISGRRLHGVLSRAQILRLLRNSAEVHGR